MSASTLNITFSATTKHGEIIKKQDLTPSFINPTRYKGLTNFYFIPTIRLNDKMFKQDLGEEDKKKIFVSSFMMSNYLSQLQRKNFKPLPITIARKKGIIHSNISYILDLYLKKGTKIILGENKVYTLNNYTWDKVFNTTYGSNTKVPSFSINIDLILHEGTEMSFVDSTRLSCIQKREAIVQEYHKIMGLKAPPKKVAESKHIPIAYPVQVAQPVNNIDSITTTTTKYKGGNRKTHKNSKSNKNKTSKYRKNSKNSKNINCIDYSHLL